LFYRDQNAELITQSFTLKKQSENFLEVAKRALKMAIEENEAVALAFIKKRITHQNNKNVTIYKRI
jgi:type I restriction enzyme S subunit/type I restriction enzyme M protein